MEKVKTPAHEGEGFECLLAGDNEALTTKAARVQFFSRYGIPQNRVGLFGSLYFGETKRG